MKEKEAHEMIKQVFALMKLVEEHDMKKRLKDCGRCEMPLIEKEYCHNCGAVFEGDFIKGERG